jgi:hypothetical protein
MPRTSPGRTLGEARRATEHAQILVHRADSPTYFRSARDAAECGGRRQNKPVWLPVHGHNGVAVSVTLIRVAVSACASRLHPSAWQAPRHCLLPNLSCPSSARARVFCMPVYLAFRRRSPLGPPSRSRRGMCSASTARCCTTATARSASATTAHPMRQCESADQRPQGCTASAPCARSTALTQ